MSVNNSSKGTLSESTSEGPARPDQQATGGNMNVINISFPSNHGQHVRQIYHSNPCPRTQEEASERNSSMKPTRRHLVRSREILTCTGPARKTLASPTLSQDLKECVNSEKEELPSGCFPFDVASTNSSEVAIRVDHKHPNTGQLSSPQHSKVATPSTVTTTCGGNTELELEGRVHEAGKCQEVLTAAAMATCTCTTEGVGVREEAGLTTTEVGGVRQRNVRATSPPEDGTKSNPVSTMVKGVVRNLKVADLIVGIDDTEEEMISPEARALITDEILKEYQRSSSSCATSNLSQETAMHDNITNPDITQVSQGETQTITSSSFHTDTPAATLSHNNQHSISTISTPKGPEYEPALLCGISEDALTTSYGAAVNDLQAEESERELSAKSSCIFVDMSSLNLDQVQAEDEVDQSSDD